jgi:hypothetical protein
MRNVIVAIVLFASVARAGLTYTDDVTFLGTADGVNYYDLSGSVAASWTDDGLLQAHWNLQADSTNAAGDYVGTTNPLVALNQPNLATGPARFDGIYTNQNGRAEDILWFDGSDDWLMATDMLAIDTNTMGAFSCWFFLDANNGGVLLGTVQQATTTYQWWLEVQFNYVVLRTKQGAGDRNILVSSPAIATNQWYHIVTTLSANSATNLVYLNGTNLALSVSQGANQGEWFGDISNRDRFGFGQVHESSAKTLLFDGFIYDPRLYWTVIDQTKIREIRDNTRPTDNIEVRP